MTIGWCTWGRVWGKPVCIVLVRHTRYSFEKLSQYPYFTVSVPAANEMQEELAYCGTVSGRDEDKLSALGLEILPSRSGKVNPLAGCALHFECRVLMQLDMTAMTINSLPPDIFRFYDPAHQGSVGSDPHMVYFGEILEAYQT